MCYLNIPFSGSHPNSWVDYNTYDSLMNGNKINLQIIPCQAMEMFWKYTTLQTRRNKTQW